jgi:hypothetical protein
MMKTYLAAAGELMEALHFTIGTYAIGIMHSAYRAGLKCGSYLFGRST